MTNTSAVETWRHTNDDAPRHVAWFPSVDGQIAEYRGFKLECYWQGQIPFCRDYGWTITNPTANVKQSGIAYNARDAKRHAADAIDTLLAAGQE